MKKSALILEDELVIALLLSHILEEYGFDNIRVSSEGNRAIDVALEIEPDLIIIDINLHRMNGFEVIKELRDRFSYKMPTILIISAQNMAEELLLEIGLSSKKFISKPFSKREICNFLQEESF